MKLPWTLLPMLALVLSVNIANSKPLSENTAIVTSYGKVSEAIIAQRIQELDLPFEARNTSQVRSYIRRYLVEGYRDAEDILGRSVLYFPIFEHYLDQYNLPEALKFLPIVESGLRPAVHSPVGAAGLWQFVPSTARVYGLTVNGQVDERLDPHKATQAAAQMLAALYEQFGDWALVLAAYNCGPGRVRKAIRSAGSKDFWKVKAFLPRESQRYIPSFIAAAYLMNHYGSHGLSPDYLSDDMQDTRTYVFEGSLHLSTVARELGVSYRTLQKLNPSFKQGLIADKEAGQYITVPTRVAQQFVANYMEPQAQTAPQNYTMNKYITVAGDNLPTLARLFKTTVEDIVKWNNLSSEQLTVNQELIIYMPRQLARP